LTVKLKQRGFGSDVAEEVTSGLIERGLLDDKRYAELWIRSRMAQRKAHSPRKLLVSLAKRGVERHSSHEAINSILDEETEYTMLLKYLEKMELSEEGSSIRADLKNEGFSPDTINRFFESK